MSVWGENRSGSGDRGGVAVMLVAGAALVFALAPAAVLAVAAAAALMLTGRGWALPVWSGWVAHAWAMVTHSGDLRVWGPPWSVLALTPVLYWATVAVLGALTVVLVGNAAAWWWRWYGPVRPGHASRAELRKELSVGACRDLARTKTRPGLNPAQCRRAPPDEVGIALHRGPIGRMWVPLLSHTCALGPSQSGKSREHMAPVAIDAPGALLCQSTRPDVLLFSALARTRRLLLAGAVYVFDATATVAWPAQWGWDPVRGCEDADVAMRRAHTLVEASGVKIEIGGGAGNDRLFRERAEKVLTAYLLAAALRGLEVDAVLDWAINRHDPAPAEILARYPDAAHTAANLRAEQDLPERTAGAVWLAVRRVMEPLMTPRLQQLCRPGSRGVDHLDPKTLIGNQASLYLIAGTQEDTGAVPLLTALAQEWLLAARGLALSYPEERLDPPATAVFDELTNATPIPDLPETISDALARGVLVHWAAQSLSQLYNTFGEHGARTLLSNTATKSFWGGIDDLPTMNWISALFGTYERASYQHHTDGMFSPSRSSVGTVTVPVIAPGDVRMIPRGEVLTAYRGMRAIHAHTIDVLKRPDGRQIRRDMAAIRSGDLAGLVDHRGLRVDTPTEQGPSGPARPG